MRKKILAVILLLSLCVSLFGCENAPAETDPVLSATGESEQPKVFSNKAKQMRIRKNFFFKIALRSFDVL